MVFLRLPSLIIKEMISVNVTIGVNGHTPFPDKWFFFFFFFFNEDLESDAYV